MDSTDSAVAAIRRALEQFHTFLVCGHEEPDGDSIGSQLALLHRLERMGKKAAVVAEGPTLGNYRFLPGFAKICPSTPEGFEAQATVCVDTASAERLPRGAVPQGLVINIDHHAGNSRFGAINWIDPEAAAVGEQIFALFDNWAMPLSPEEAGCLYFAVLTDTGSFQYSKTSARTFEIAAALVEAGADPYALASAYYCDIHPDTVRLVGEVLAHLRFELEGRLVWGEITREMYERFGGPERHPEQLASQLRAIRGVEVAVLFHETGPGDGGASLRSRGRVDVSAVAAELGGGGHPSAAGCRLRGDYALWRERVLEAARRHIEKAFG